jgi:hypothetical protein
MTGHRADDVGAAAVVEFASVTDWAARHGSNLPARSTGSAAEARTKR